MQGLKYLTVEDLEKFIVNLKAEIDDLQKTSWRVGSIAHKTLETSKEMLRQAEDEVLERTLLQVPGPKEI